MVQLAQHRVCISKAHLRASRILTLVVVLVFGAASAPLAKAQTFTTLYNFTDGTDGAYPEAGVVEDQASNLYGTTESGGSSNSGVVFRLSLSGTETVLYNFSGGSDGGYPVAPLTRDDNGMLYGTTYSGGAYGEGVVFMVDSGTETVLHSFAGGTTDGCYPDGGLAMDKDGGLYGTTNSCGANDKGIVFKLNKKGTFTLLHSFAGGPTDGASPSYTGLVVTKEGEVYGVTTGGGSSSKGVVYKLTKKGITVLHSFAGGTTDGCGPHGTPALDTTGNLYGTTYGCGSSSYGTVWKVSQKGAETILHSFAGYPTDGCGALGGVVLDSKGNLYGNTDSCGAKGYYGTVWKLGKGTFSLLHSFADSDGASPWGDLLRDVKGGLYGTTVSGGSDYYGTVWKYVP